MTLEDIFPNGFYSELKQISKLAFPLVLSQFLQMTFGPMSLIFCGRFGPIPLACAALSTSLINVTGISVVMGLSAACDTLYTQTYGSKNRHKLGILVQRAIILLLLGLMPCFALHLNTEQFLLVVKQNPVVAHLCGDYMLIAIPGIAAFSVFLTLAKYVQCQDIVVPIMLVCVMANVVCGVLHYTLMFQLDMGTNGSAWAITAGYCTLLILTVLYIIISGMYKDTWRGFDLDCFLEWGQFLRLAYWGLFMMGFEWWAFEAGVVLAGILGTKELDAQSVVFQVECMTYMLLFGVGFAASIRVGQYLGGHSAAGAKTATRVALAFICVTGLTVGILIGALRWQLPRIFTNNEEVIELAANVFPVLAFYMVFNSINGVGSGILRGMGRQRLGSLLIFIVYSIALVSGVPTLLLSPLSIRGYWLCLAVSLMVMSIVLSVILLRTNWDNEVAKAIQRTNIASHGEQATHGTGSIGDTHLPGKTNQIEDNETEQLLDKPRGPKNLVLLRLLTIGGYVMVFVIGIIIRIFLPPEPLPYQMLNFTSNTNGSEGEFHLSFH